MYSCKIEFVYLAELYLLIHNSECLGILRCDNYTTGVSVDTVAKGRGKALLVPRVILTLLIEIRLHVRNKSVDLGVLILVHRYAGAFIEKHYVPVFVHYIELGLDVGKGERNVVGLVELCEEFLREKALYSITLCEHGVVFRALSVDLDFLRAY